MKVLLALGILPWVVLGVLHLFGLRNDAGFLSGAPVQSATAGGVYVLTYFAAVVVAPVLLLAAALIALTKRLAPRAS
jgi:hypothetical protein